VTANVQNSRLRDQIEPPAVEAWLNAARKFASVPLNGHQHQPRFVPLPDVVTGVANLQKAKEFVAVWRIVKHPWVHEVYMLRRPPEFATRRAWKSFTAGSFSTSEIQPNNDTSVARINFAEFLGWRKVLRLDRGSYAYLQEEIPRPVRDMITVDMVREVVRELTDLNFFFDMFEVEYRRTYDDPAEISNRMRPIMSPGSFSFPLPVPRSDLSDRATWLVAIRDFIEPWPGTESPAFHVQIPDPPTLEAVLSLESAVAEVYCSNVTFTLRRRPVIPCYM
jgi:hypothetical protein